FDSLRFSGIRLFRDMQMLPDSMQSFTPLVQGVANFYFPDIVWYADECE
ncbi:Fimbrial usher protein, partial [human gut metagenome]